MKAGGLLSKHDSACIFKPDIKHTKETIVSKIDKSTNLDNEIRLLNRMKGIDPEGRFHSMFIERFPLDSVSIPEEYSECRHSKEDVRDMGVMNIKYVGKKTLLKYLNVDFKTLNDDDIAMLFVRISNVIAGLFRMNQKNVFHNDTHLNNIIICLDEGKKVPDEYGIKIIDFGLGTLDRAKYSNKNDFDDFFSNIEFAAEFFMIGEDGKGYDLSKILEKSNEGSVDYIKTIKNYITYLKETFGERYSSIAYDTYFRDLIDRGSILGGANKKKILKRSRKRLYSRRKTVNKVKKNNKSQGRKRKSQVRKKKY